MFELAFWVLYFYQELLQNARLPPETEEKIHGAGMLHFIQNSRYETY
jgi:hypothetical protein